MRTTAFPRSRISRAVLIERLPGYAAQVLLLALVAWLAWYGAANFLRNIGSLGVSLGYGFLDNEAGFEISQSLLRFDTVSSYRDAVVVATLNTLLVVVLSAVVSTVLGICIAFGRLVEHPLVRGASSAYVEVFRNIPLLLQIFFWYFSAMAVLPSVADGYQLGTVMLNNRGLFLPWLQMSVVGAWSLVGACIAFVMLSLLARRVLTANAHVGMDRSGLAVLVIAIAFLCFSALWFLPGEFTLDRPQADGFNISGGLTLLPELIALTMGLSIYNSAFLAEIFRAGILSVPRGQTEAAATVGLSGVRGALLVTMPQALRVALPPAAGQYQTLAKASSLAAAIGYPDVMQIVGGTILTQTNQALEAMALVMVIYATINLMIALAANLTNRWLPGKQGN